MISEQLRKFVPLIFAVIFCVLSINSISYKSHTRDENRHLVRGVMLLETGDYRLNKHHPVLANVIAAVPQLFNHEFKVPSTDSDLWRSANKDGLAEELVNINGGKRDFAFNVLNKSRYFMIIIFALCGLWVVSEINKEFGYTTAVIFAFLYYFSPNLIANAQLVTSDALIVPLSFLSTLYLYKYSKYYDNLFFILFIFVSFLSLITKYSVIPVAFVWIVILFITTYKHEKQKRLMIWKAIRNCLIVLISWLILLTATYGFRFESLKSTNYEDPQKTENNLFDLANFLKYTPSLIEPAQNIYINTPLPFPEYIQGFLDNVVFHNAYGHDTFLAGQYSKTGWWYYFPMSMAIKMPIPILFGTVILFILGTRYLIEKRFKIGSLIILAAIPAFYMLLSMSSNINLGLRHILIVFPFLYLGIAYLVSKAIRIKKTRIPLIVFGLWYVISAILIYPHYLEYFNEIVGGPKNGHFYLLDSNLSWAQDDFLVEDYINNLNTDKKIFENPLEKITAGIVVIDVDLLMGRDVNKRPKTEWIREKYLNGEIEPIDRIAYTYLVFEF
ncbi:MAG: hypothetical protein ABIC57_04125 [bacterium]